MPPLDERRASIRLPHCGLTSWAPVAGHTAATSAFRRGAGKVSVAEAHNPGARIIFDGEPVRADRIRTKFIKPADLGAVINKIFIRTNIDVWIRAARKGE
jgi:hypothetical protein